MKKLGFALILLAVLLLFALILVARAEERPPEPELTYLPIVHSWRYTPTPEVTVTPPSGLVPDYMYVHVDARGCSSAWVEFGGVDRLIYTPIFYHPECYIPDTGGYTTTVGATLYFPDMPVMSWTEMYVTVYYPGRSPITVTVQGPWEVK